jgi:CBS domain-containing protein
VETTESTPGKPDLSGNVRAADIMTAPVVSIAPDTPVPEIAALLLEKHISAVPVVDGGGVPIGMVSEGDLVGRAEPERLARMDWWLGVAAGRAKLPEGLADARRPAQDVMASPVVTVGEDTDAGEIARLFAIHRIKRVPVLKDGRMVGIVSRANLLRVVAAGHPAGHTAEAEKPHRTILGALLGDYHLPAWETVAGIRARKAGQDLPGPKEEPRFAAEDFRTLERDHKQGEAAHREAARREAALQRRQRLAGLIDAHISDEGWRQLMHRAREAAEAGEKACLLMRFPSQLCIDGGRTINIADPGWPASLRGRPAEVYLRWERELKPRGFAMTAQVLEFPGGEPGDIGLFLGWGE